MNIKPVHNNVSMQRKNNSFSDKIVQKILNMFPNKIVKCSTKKINNWNNIDKTISSPMWNRGIMGATALITQPTIDYYNKNVDSDTRVVSRNRTIAKIVIGTLVGMLLVRGPLHKFAKCCTDLNGKTKFSKFLLPKKYIDDMKKNPKLLDNYRASLAMVMVLVANCFTNFLIDAPLTTKLANKLNKLSKVGTKKGDNNG